jgi:uncharacterized membrane protein YhhN
MDFTLILIALLGAIIDWFAVEKNWKVVEYFAKPSVAFLLIIWLLLFGGYQGQLLFFTLGLIFCLAGDIFLLFPGRFFMLGLLSFMIAQVTFIFGINQTLPPINLASVAILILVILTTARLYLRIAQGLSQKGRTNLRIPILIYCLVIGLMLVSALLTLVRPNSEWGSFSALLISMGALLFYISDSINAWERFISTLPHGRLAIMVTYHLALILIAVSAVLNFFPGGA